MSGREKRERILLVDDDDAFRAVLARELRRRGFEVETAASGATALDLAAARPPAVVLLDLRLGDMDGIDVLRRLIDSGLAAGVILLTGHGTIDSAIQAIKLGAYDYLEKPCPVDKIEMTIRKALEHLGLLARQSVLEDGLRPPDPRREMVGSGPAFQRLMDQAERVAPTDAAVLIQGETGSGKEMVARLIHTLSPRSDRPFVAVNCAALHEDLLLSELFGHEKGAFSGALRRKHGLFEVADGGTLFLDEIGDTSPASQAVLLRALETGRFRRVGGTEEIAVDVRLISATNRDLGDPGESRFREDLYYRLATVRIDVPPLRERREDLPLLIEHFCSLQNLRSGRRSRFSREAMAALLNYDWPGNVRQLIHVVEQAFILSRRRILPLEVLPPDLRQPEAPAADPDQELVPLDVVEWRHIRKVLAAVDGNRARAAAILGISERTLYRLIARHQEGGRESD
ncbi:MAG: sigma-54-dependent Fis family transcriptional regulator [Planctomycetota bacterium]|nr:MAG: sigma-54-dependent Fis family transcriptional regulator [Planctomycetota bacterium]